MKILSLIKRANRPVKTRFKSKRLMRFKDWTNKVYEPLKQREKQVEWGGKIWTDPVYD
jgi:hypothetical protein